MPEEEKKELERLLRKLYKTIGVDIGEGAHYDAILKIADGRIMHYTCTPKGK